MSPLLRLCVLAALFICQPALALTFKSDGSVVQKSGEVVTKTYADRFKEQFSNPDASRWAIADGRPENPPGYFGNDIFLPGTPLLRLSKIRQGEDYLAALADKNGFADKGALQRFIISNASPEFLEELELGEEQAVSYVAAGVAEAKNLGQDYSQMVEDLQTVALEVASTVQEQVESQVQSQVAEQVEESVGDSVSEAVGESVGSAVAESVGSVVAEVVAEAVTEAVDEAVSDAVAEAIERGLSDYMIETLKEWEAAGYTDIVIRDDGMSATCPDSGCI